MATKFDRESFNLLKMTDSGSESVPDHSFEIAHQSRNKKKVRLKRWVHQIKKSNCLFIKIYPNNIPSLFR